MCGIAVGLSVPHMCGRLVAVSFFILLGLYELNVSVLICNWYGDIGIFSWDCWKPQKCQNSIKTLDCYTLLLYKNALDCYTLLLYGGVKMELCSWHFCSARPKIFSGSVPVHQVGSAEYPLEPKAAAGLLQTAGALGFTVEYRHRQMYTKVHA